MKSKRKARQRKLLYVKLASLADLCRYACNFDYTNSSVMAVRSGPGYVIFAMGEEICGTSMAYYVNSATKESMISYTYPSWPAQPEEAHFTEQFSSQGVHCMNIMNIGRADLKPAALKPSAAPAIVELSDPHDLIRAVIRKGVQTESIQHVYSFAHRGSAVLCAFDAVEELSGEEKTLYYSVQKGGTHGNFARYKYSENEVDFTGYMGEHSYMYVKIINLAEPFPFFKMPD